MDGENVGTPPEETKVEVPVTAADSTSQQPVTPEPTPTVATPEQPTATETIATEPKKSGNWKLIVCIVLLAALVGLVVYYWSTGAF